MDKIVKDSELLPQMFRKEVQTRNEFKDKMDSSQAKMEVMQK